MVAASIALAALAVALAWPVPLVLSRAAWPARSPAVALILWQAIALAGGLSMIGALLTFGLAPFGGDLVGSAMAFAADPAAHSNPANWLALAGAVLLGGHLVLNLVTTVVRAEVQRRRHRHLVDLLSSPFPDNPRARVIDSPAPVAYCLPGPLGSITVFSAGLIALLSEDELRAVIEHERAHVVQRHDVVLVLFRAWHASLPWFPIAHRAQRHVGQLIEMLADDRARRVVDDSTLARAIMLTGSGLPAVVAGGGAPGLAPAEVLVPAELSAPAAAVAPAPVLAAAPVPHPDALTARVLRLERRPLPVAAEALVAGTAAALLAVPTVLLLLPALLP